MSTDDGNYNCNYYWSENFNWYVMSNVNGTISGAITIAGQESGLAPVTVMITITKLERNLKCNIPVFVTSFQQ